MTAGPDERTLHAIDGGGPETEQEAEARIREELHRRGVGPGGPASSPPPMPLHPPTIPAQPGDGSDHQEPAQEAEHEGFPDWLRAKRDALRKLREADTSDVDQELDDAADQDAAPARASNDRLPDWWAPRKPNVGELDVDEEEPGEEPTPDEDRVSPATGPGDGPRPSRRAVFKVSRRAPADDEPDDGAEEAGQEQVPEGPRWSRPALGRPPGLPPKRQNLITWWRGMAPHNKWLLYHGTGLGAGLYFGIPAYGYEGHRFIADNPADDLEVWATWGLLGILLVTDYRVRNLFPPLAWAVRALSTSVIVGAAWYGTPLADITL